MRILVIQENGRHVLNRIFRECFSLMRAFHHHGHVAVVWGLGHPNFGEKPNWNDYDVILNLENYDEKGWLPNLSEARAYKIVWAIDEHCKGTAYYQNIFKRDKAQLLLHSTRDYAKASHDWWFPNCYDDTLIMPMVVPIRADVGFCGNINNRGSKIDLLRKNFKFAGDIFVIGNAMVRAINSYRVSFNCNISNDVNYRSFETIGCRVPLATNFNPQYPDLGFIDGENCLMYKNNEEMIDKIRNLLKNEAKRKVMAEAGYRLAVKHTYKKRVGELLEKLSGK